MNGDLARWLDAQEARSVAAIEAAVSAVHLSHRREDFGQTIRPAAGSVLASPVPARWDPAPDYFYHWARDASVVMMLAPALAARPGGEAWRQRVADFASFSLATTERPGPAENPLRPTTRPEALRFLRPDEELAALRGDALLGEPRVNADGTPDLERWSRPQFDGPALRALALMRWEAAAGTSGATGRVIARDLDFTRRHAALPCIGPWEEEGEHDLHAFTLLVQHAALAAGAERRGDAALAGAARRALAAAEALWSPADGWLRARAGAAGSDAAVLLAVLAAGRGDGPLSLADDRVLATAAALEAQFTAAYPLNRTGLLAMGRNADDRFFGGNPWVPVTLGFAEFHHALAMRVAAGRPLPRSPASAAFLDRVLGDDRAALAGDPARQADRLRAHGDRFLATVMATAPGDWRLPEQMDRETGAPVSSPDLTWSHAALIAAAEARRRALASG